MVMCINYVYSVLTIIYSPGVGNYDVNVMLNALQQKGLSTRWFDGRRRM